MTTHLRVRIAAFSATAASLRRFEEVVDDPDRHYAEDVEKAHAAIAEHGPLADVERALKVLRRQRPRVRLTRRPDETTRKGVNGD